VARLKHGVANGVVADGEANHYAHVFEDEGLDIYGYMISL